MHVPKLDEGKFSVILADYKTGHILNKKKSLYLKNSNQEFYYEFENEGEAYNYASRIFNDIANKHIEILIYNSRAELVENFRPSISDKKNKPRFFDFIKALMTKFS